MQGVGLIILSIVLATALMVGASYGAQYLAPLLRENPAAWMIAAAAALLPLGYLLSRRRRARA